MPVYDLVAATDFPAKPAEAPSWTLVVPEPSTLMGFNTDKILLQPEGERKRGGGQREMGRQPARSWCRRRWFRASRMPAMRNRSAALEMASPATISFSSTSGASISRRPKTLSRISTSSPSSPTRTARSSPRGPSRPPRPAKGSDAQAYVDAFDEAFTKLETDLVDLDRDHACQRAAGRRARRAGRAVAAGREPPSRTAACRAVGVPTSPDSLKPLRVGLPRLRPLLDLNQRGSFFERDRLG